MHFCKGYRNRVLVYQEYRFESAFGHVSINMAWKDNNLCKSVQKLLKVHKLDTLNRVIFPNCGITTIDDSMNTRIYCKRFHTQK